MTKNSIKGGSCLNRSQRPRFWSKIYHIKTELLPKHPRHSIAQVSKEKKKRKERASGHFSNLESSNRHSGDTLVWTSQYIQDPQFQASAYSDKLVVDAFKHSAGRMPSMRPTSLFHSEPHHFRLLQNQNSLSEVWHVTTCTSTFGKSEGYLTKQAFLHLSTCARARLCLFVCMSTKEFLITQLTHPGNTFRGDLQRKDWEKKFERTIVSPKTFTRLSLH